MPDAMQLYREFLAGKPGTCIFTGVEGCHAFVTEDEIEATYGSRHDGHHFVWLDRKPGEVGPEGIGFVSDDYIDVLLARHRIAFTYSDMGGPLGETHEGVKAAFLLGAARMSRVLALPGLGDVYKRQSAFRPTPSTPCRSVGVSGSKGSPCPPQSPWPGLSKR